MPCLGNTPVDIFYQQGADYNYDKPTFDLSSQNFINIMSKATTHVGAGIGYNHDHTKAYVVLFFTALDVTNRDIQKDVLPDTC